MTPRLILLLIALATPMLGACAPLIGAGALVVADTIAEDENGGDGLF